MRYRRRYFNVWAKSTHLLLIVIFEHTNCIFWLRYIFFIYGSTRAGGVSRVSGDRHPATGNRWRVTGTRRPATGHRQPVTGNRSPATDHRQMVTAHRSLVTLYVCWPLLARLAVYTDRICNDRVHQPYEDIVKDSTNGHRELPSSADQRRIPLDSKPAPQCCPCHTSWYSPLPSDLQVPISRYHTETVQI